MYLERILAGLKVQATPSHHVVSTCPALLSHNVLQQAPRPSRRILAANRDDESSFGRARTQDPVHTFDGGENVGHLSSRVLHIRIPDVTDNHVFGDGCGMKSPIHPPEEIDLHARMPKSAKKALVR
jgi:hypothetical protein